MLAQAHPLDMANFIIWTLWTDRSEILASVSASTPEAAIAQAVAMGLVSGLGARRSYLGLHAEAV